MSARVHLHACTGMRMCVHGTSWTATAFPHGRASQAYLSLLPACLPR